MKKISVISSVVFIVLIILKPSVCTSGAAEGIILSGRVIIPSLFPFTVCVLFIIKSDFHNAINFLKPFTKKVFGLSPRLFGIMILSFIGGYPVGGKLLNEAVRNKTVSPKNAGYMLNYCVNAGPAFVIIAVGGGIVGSKTVGYILLSAHLISSLFLSLFFGFFIKKDSSVPVKENKKSNLADNFVLSVSEGASAVFSICAYVILFSTIMAYVNCYSVKFPFLRYVSPLLEVTNAVSGIRNILVISFLLGFAGLSIWCQILSVGRLIKINFLIFAVSRVVHGLLSVLITALLLKIFGIAVNVSGGVRFSPTYGGPALALSSFTMVIIFIISLYNKKITGNIIEDIV